jgi:hypothetical protein
VRSDGGKRRLLRTVAFRNGRVPFSLARRRFDHGLRASERCFTL